LLQLVPVSRLDDAQNRLRLRQIELAGEKGPHRELARLRGAGASAQAFRNQQVHERRTAERVNLDDVLPRVRARRRPEMELSGQGRGYAGQTCLGVDDLPATARKSRGKEARRHVKGTAAAETDDGPRPRPGRAR
jgi:hypothetical protein